MLTGKPAHEVRQTLLQRDCVHILAVRIEKQVITGENVNKIRYVPNRMDLGSGCRVIDKDGSFHADFNVVVRPWREI